ncbi:tetratricopeptide repeat protein [Marinobacter halodurans]|uniref:Tetratricopeptide repeat protein n=1 Tax=Marinobacter halodurans TaxID=2528979 RepID=A0ABY1ZFX8_9GAMM|nr:tetratricopeptide repeat protein [Marinobacter halodurans]TBW50176.1 tetratricopeptide repeat protein [Marinobacter halodurans]
MKWKTLFRITLLAVAFTSLLTGCGDDKEEMSQQELQYLSHLDQSRFFQRQGELKASTLEARSAIDLNPKKVDPYFVIIDNLITAGDAVSAARQVKEIEKRLQEKGTTDDIHNRIQLILARTYLMRQDTEAALDALDKLKSPDRTQQVRADLLRGDILLAAKQYQQAESAYQKALDSDATSTLALIGLSRVAQAQGNTELARQKIKQAEDEDANDPELWLWKAQLAQQQKQWRKSEEAYIRALEDIGKYDIMTYRKYTTISSLVDVLREEGKSSEAFVYEEILAKSAPGTVKSNFEAAQEAYRKGDLEKAARYLNEVLKQAPSHVQSSIMLGLIRFQQGRVEEAQELLEPISQIQDSPAASKLLAATQLRLQRPDEARKLLENLDDKQSDPGVLALIGIAHLASGDDEAGRTYIEKALQLDPGNDDLRLRYANYLVEQGDTEAAIKQASQVMDAHPDNDQARRMIINAYVRGGDTQAAEESASAWVKEQPKNISALLVSGSLAARADDASQARQYYRQALELSDTDPRANNALGALAASQDNTEEAIRQFRTAIDKAPDNRPAIQGLAQVTSPDQLQTYLEKVTKDHPDALAPKLALLELALRANNINRADELSAALLEPVSETELSPHTGSVADVYSAVAGSKLKANNKDAALAIMKRAQVLFPDNEAIALQTAQVYFEMDNEKAARDILQEVRLKHPDSAQPYLVEAAHEKGKERFGKAADLYELALAKDSSPQLTLLFVDALEQSQQAMRAIKALENGLEDHPGNETLQMRLAMAYQTSGDAQKAMDAYQTVLKSSPQNVVALNNLAWLYHESGKQDARQLAEKAYSLKPDSAAVADTYGWILFQQGDHSQSLPVLEKAYKLSPQTPEIAQHLAEAYKSTGRPDEAEKILSKL